MGYVIDTSSLDEARLKAQAAKMAPKVSRPEMQMAYIAEVLNLSRESLTGPDVIHI